MSFFYSPRLETQENQNKDPTWLQTKLCKAISAVLRPTSEVEKLNQATPIKKI